MLESSFAVEEICSKTRKRRLRAAATRRHLFEVSQSVTSTNQIAITVAELSGKLDHVLWLLNNCWTPSYQYSGDETQSESVPAYLNPSIDHVLRNSGGQWQHTPNGNQDQADSSPLHDGHCVSEDTTTCAYARERGDFRRLPNAAWASLHSLFVRESTREDQLQSTSIGSDANLLENASTVELGDFRSLPRAAWASIHSMFAVTDNYHMAGTHGDKEFSSHQVQYIINTVVNSFAERVQLPSTIFASVSTTMNNCLIPLGDPDLPRFSRAEAEDIISLATSRCADVCDGKKAKCPKCQRCFTNVKMFEMHMSWHEDNEQSGH